MLHLFNFDLSKLDFEPRKNLSAKLDTSLIEMGEFDSAYLAALIKQFRPLNILEVGVSAGGTSALILGILESLNLPANLTSVDLNDNWYRDRTKKTGFLTEALPDRGNFHLHTGKFLPELIEDFPSKFDFIFLDTVHSLPGEVLDYLVSLQFITDNGVFVFHDTLLHFYHREAWATRLLYDACIGNKFMCLDLNHGLPNISAFQVNGDTFRYVENVFGTLAMQWRYDIGDRQFHIYYAFFSKYYGREAAEWFYACYRRNADRLAKLAQGARPRPAPPAARSDREIIKLLMRQSCKNILPYGIIKFFQNYRTK